jgi:CarD family transcriptional regulator
MQSFELNDTVLYGNNGVCRIDAVETRADGDYYILVPVHKDRTKLMVPLRNEMLVGRMRAIPSKSDAASYIREAAKKDARWISDSTERKEHAKKVLHNGTEVELLLLARSFATHKQKMLEAGKKTSSSDNGILRSAQDRVRDEFSVVFDIAPDEVDDFIALQAV